MLLVLIKGVLTKQNDLIRRSLRLAMMLRKRAGSRVLRKLANEFLPKGDYLTELQGYLQAVDEIEPAAMEVDSAEPSAPAASAGSLGGTACVEELGAFLHLSVLLLLLDTAAKPGHEKEGLDHMACHCADVLVDHLMAFNKRTLDMISARAFFYYSLSYTRCGNQSTIREKLLRLYRSSCIRHDEWGQAVLKNAILANYLSDNLYSQADMFRLKSAELEPRDNNHHARYLYYTGKINTLGLHYGEAYENLSQALRKCPRKALGFKQSATKLQVIVQLLMGEIPERAVFLDNELRRSLLPYFKLTQAVRVGDLKAFEDALAAHGKQFEKDGMSSLTTRLRHNVIKTGLRKISIAYSKISVKAICEKLSFDSVEDMEYIIAKAIHDGVIEAFLDPKAGFMYSKSTMDVYSTQLPQKAFHKRINFCLKVHEDSIKAMTYPEDAHKAGEKGAKDKKDKNKKKEGGKGKKKEDKK